MGGVYCEWGVQLPRLHGAIDHSPLARRQGVHGRRWCESGGAAFARGALIHRPPPQVEVLLPFTAGDLLAECHKVCSSRCSLF